MRPNIFDIATKELNQDAFITWLLQFADNKYHSANLKLNECGRTFVKQLIKKQLTTFDELIDKVEAGRQWENIDVWAEINDKYLIIIEDKTFSSHHSDQLARYKENAEKWCEKNNYENPICIYLKTGNESLATLNKIVEKGYLTIDRRKVLNILEKRQITNEIFNDFKDYLTIIENATNSFTKFENITSEWKAGEGFYIKLQEQINEWTDWRYVANQMGGFLGFWYHWKGTEEIESIYIQIENAFEYGIKLVIKISDWEPSTETLYNLLNEIKPFAEKNGLSISKPDKYRAGATSTLAVVQNAFETDKDGNIEIDNFIKTLQNLEKTIDEYCIDKQHSR